MTQDLHEKLARYADNELDAPERAALESEIARSPELAAEVARWKALRCCAGRAMRDCCVSASFEARLRDKVGRAGSFSGSRTYKVASVLAVAAAIILFFVFRSPRPSAPRPGIALAGVVSPERFADVYESCAKKHHDGVKLESACAKSAEALATQMCCGYQVAVPDLTSLGYNLAGMCRCLDESGVHALHVYYQSEADPNVLLSLFSVSRCTPLAECSKSHCCVTQRDYEFSSVHGVTVLRWDERGGHYAMASEQKPEALAELAAGVRVASAGPPAGLAGPQPK
jgi:hypothetical protein